MRLVSIALCLALAGPARAAKLYWFVPDGLRADPQVLDLFGWARAGKLPNIKRMMDEGSWGYSIPAFPSHTPVNFATLMTGAWPEKHGVADGPMRVEGFALEKPSVAGFSSTAKRVAPIWKTLEKEGLKVALLSIPGSTPPELEAGATFRGRWGNWGADFHALNFQTEGAEASRRERGLGARLFYLGPELTRDVPARPAEGWAPEFAASAPARELTLLAYGATIHVHAGDQVALSLDKKTPLARLEKEGDWTGWLPVTLQWKGSPVATQFKACLIARGKDGFLKVRLLFNVLNRTIVQPPGAAEALQAGAGPMVDFPDNWPAQLNRLPQERGVLLAEALEALSWHRRAAARLLSEERPDVLIQDTYVPNQILESRWWLKHVDPAAPAYKGTPAAERKARAADLLKVYQGVDAILGEALARASTDTVIALSSDHGVLPIVKEVQLNNLLAKEGLLSFETDANGETRIDWARSKAAFLKMIGVYVHPGGLAGPWKRGSGPEYEALRARVTGLIAGLKDGETPVVERVLPWERVGELRLPPDRVPDLVLAMTPGYALTEDMSKDGPALREALQSGYKQAVIADGRPGLWTPFVVMGPGVRKGFRLERPIHNVDQAPTLLALIGSRAQGAEGKVVDELLACRPEPVPGPGPVEAASRLSEAGRPEEALRLLRCAIEAQPRSYGLRVHFGQLLAQEGRLEEAGAAFREARRIAPERALAYVQEGYVRARAGRQGEAVDLLERRARSRPDDPIYRHHLASVRYFGGDLPGALSEIELARKLWEKSGETDDDQYLHTLCWHGRLLRLSGRHDEALPVLERVIGSPRRSHMRVNAAGEKARILDARGRADEARAVLEKGLEDCADPDVDDGRVACPRAKLELAGKLLARDSRRALALGEEAFAEMRGGPVAERDERATAYLLAMSFFEAAGRPGLARQAREEALSAFRQSGAKFDYDSVVKGASLP